jgi:preprotein translocase subunit SecG
MKTIFFIIIFIVILISIILLLNQNRIIEGHGCGGYGGYGGRGWGRGFNSCL